MSGTENKKVGLVVKAASQACQKADQLEKWLNDKGVGVVRKDHEPCHPEMAQSTGTSIGEDLFCVFVLGGDGTFLSAVRWIGDREIPLIGVKFGAIGFLAETMEENLFFAAERVLERRFRIEKRMRIRVDVLREEAPVVSDTAFNDVVINKSALARLAHIDTHIDNHYLTTYRADGLIIATPTGSTAYSLAAGGPIIHPAVPGIILTPICPFTLTNRPLVVPDSVTISIRLAEKNADFILTIDGQSGLKIRYGDRISIQKSRYPVHMITFPDQQYYDVLKAKLRWSGGRV